MAEGDQKENHHLGGPLHFDTSSSMFHIFLITLHGVDHYGKYFCFLL